ncbi:hypothetical protein KAFR_0B01900 [Kazachstania africana CBS 2517]|uniref:Probable electron transfer flavoprotein subunit alpha n=1 Tax=Kazachstania africana (strain ATCC 22294 / BCRC 22015 / CBS 2517 / CECT 1963 / NBRC 1671 / NRRL Y-8276) TaxID=1071382 RepID=H2AQ39_KAZAF|nr:hypothetical protein KAFR_0B01900 [Kazachstania africana CBS 2517]CCF56489.1 hypothetical protein KAFR_0B01900 [Kazachstania africana CBS 2517]
MYKLSILNSARLIRGGIMSSRSVSTLTYIELDRNGQITSSALSSLAASRKLGDSIDALILGANAMKAASDLISSGNTNNLEKIIVAESPIYDHTLPEYISPLICELMKGSKYSSFVMASTEIGKNVLPRIGALMNTQPICDITMIHNKDTFERPIYAGNVLATIKKDGGKKLITIRASSFPPVVEGTPERIPIEKYSYTPEKDVGIRWDAENLVTNKRPDLASAKIVVSGGRALKDKKTFDGLLGSLADVLHAGIGSTRAAVDSGLCDNSLQVGQTGKIVAPDLYFAIGLSGAIQHLAGMKNSKVIVAINNDADAPIFQIADYSLEGDLFEVVPELTKKLKLMEKN